jgi:hypothetical protein
LVKDYGYPVHLKPRFSDMLVGNAVNLDAFSFLLMPSRLSRPLPGSAARVQSAFGTSLRSMRLRRVPNSRMATAAAAITW